MVDIASAAPRAGRIDLGGLWIAPPLVVVALLFLMASAWCFTATPPPIKVAKKGGYTDVHLYQDISAAVKAGQPYHAAAATLQATA